VPGRQWDRASCAGLTAGESSIVGIVDDFREGEVPLADVLAAETWCRESGMHAAPCSVAYSGPQTHDAEWLQRAGG
jgi:hypothetical protein